MSKIRVSPGAVTSSSVRLATTVLATGVSAETRYKIRTPRCQKCNALCNDQRATKCPRCGGKLR